MNRFLPLVFLLVSSSASLPMVLGNNKDNNDSRSELDSNVDYQLIVAEKEANRDDTIPDFEATEMYQDERALMRDCSGNQKYFRLDMTTDNYGFEDTWTLQRRRGNVWQQVQFGPPRNTKYASDSRFVGGFCLNPGQYKFVLKDLFRDGMCCDSGKGSYKITVDGSQKGASPSGSSNWAQRVHKFTISSGNTSGSVNTSSSGGNSNLPVNPRNDLVDRDNEWLVAHNVRRRQYHEANGKSYRPLQWSDALKRESRVWAQKLINDSCGGLKHDQNNIHGENLAANYGTGSFGNMRPADTILERWVEDEFNKIWPQNGHMTQVLWRASTHVGCSEASKPRNGGGTCRIQVCRYARPGNCNMNAYKSSNRNWWKEPVMMDTSGCLPNCPPDGC